MVTCGREIVGVRVTGRVMALRARVRCEGDSECKGEFGCKV